jgi:hypothetical protein
VHCRFLTGHKKPKNGILTRKKEEENRFVAEQRSMSFDLFADNLLLSLTFFSSETIEDEIGKVKMKFAIIGKRYKHEEHRFNLIFKTCLALQNEDNSATTQEENDASQDAFFRCEVTKVAIPWPSEDDEQSQQSERDSLIESQILNHQAFLTSEGDEKQERQHRTNNDNRYDAEDEDIQEDQVIIERR